MEVLWGDSVAIVKFIETERNYLFAICSKIKNEKLEFTSAVCSANDCGH